MGSVHGQRRSTWNSHSGIFLDFDCWRDTEEKRCGNLLQSQNCPADDLTESQNYFKDFVNEKDEKSFSFDSSNGWCLVRLAKDAKEKCLPFSGEWWWGGGKQIPSESELPSWNTLISSKVIAWEAQKEKKLGKIDRSEQIHNCSKCYFHVKENEWMKTWRKTGYG